MSLSEPRFARILAAGDVVFREGDPGETMFVVRKGRVRITKRVRGGEKTFAVLGPGEFFGEMAILTGQPRTATAIALEELTVLELDARRFETMLTTQAEIAVRILQKLARRLDDADSLITVLTKRDPKSRVILGLLREADRAGFPGSDGDAIVIQRDMDDLAEELGIKRVELDETVGRMIRVGVLRPAQEGLEIASRERLTEFLGFLEERGIVHE